MSSPGGASSAFPLHVLVWNNDYRRLDEELQEQVTGARGSWGAAGPRCAREKRPGGPARSLRDLCISLPVYLWCGSDVRRCRNIFLCQILNVGFLSVKLCCEHCSCRVALWRSRSRRAAVMDINLFIKAINSVYLNGKSTCSKSGCGCWTSNQPSPC